MIAENVYFGDSKKDEQTSEYTGFVPNSAVPANDFPLLNDNDAVLPF